MGTFYHTTNYNPLTGDLNNMVKPNQPMEYVIDKNGNGRLVASKATKTGSGNSKQGGPASKDKPTDFYGPGGMLPPA